MMTAEFRPHIEALELTVSTVQSLQADTARRLSVTIHNIQPSFGRAVFFIKILKFIIIMLKIKIGLELWIGFNQHICIFPEELLKL